MISSRTPEGLPSRCALCGSQNNLEFSDPAGDAPCPNCGHLLWFSAELLTSIQNQLANKLGIPDEGISPDTSFEELGADSLDMVELIMDFEDELNVAIPDDVAERIQTVGDAIRYVEQQRRGEQESS